jgi:hypothetical protein
MSILGWIFFGLIAGFVASRIVNAVVLVIHHAATGRRGVR